MAHPIREPRLCSTRRRVLAGLITSVSLTALSGTGRAWAQDAEVATPEPVAAPVSQPFSFDWLTDQMRAAAAEAPLAPEQVGGWISELDYDDYQRIRFHRENIRWAGAEDVPFQLNAFHLGWLFTEPVHLSEIVDGHAAPMPFTTADFDYDDLKTQVPADYEMPGVAGFRLLNPINRADHFDELAAFLGASYFRALGRDNVYGLSARGLAVNTGMPDGEEFPRFTAFWIEQPTRGMTQVTLYAALRSKSVTGAYRFVLRPGETTQVDVTARLFLRQDIQQLGIAPLTSMFLFGGADPGNFDDFRPAVHDSDALILNTRGDDTFFRPLVNPPRLGNSYLTAQDPKSFGLVQRERRFEHFLDAQAHYERRPSLMVEPLGDWGRGSVRLLEIPSDLEGNDNIVAYWVPEAQARAGDALEFSYRLHWGMQPVGDRSYQHAQVLRTRVGKGGVAGVRGDTGTQKFVIDFEGGLLRELSRDAELEPKVSVLRGEVTQAIVSPVDGTDLWRLVIEARSSGEGSMELQAALSGYGRILTETWLYQWVSE